MSAKEKFDLYFSQIHREGKDNLLQYLKDNKYFTSPSSSQYHGAYKEGNLQHSINVTETMLNVATTLNFNFNNESIIICGLFHDLGKASYYGYETYVPNILKSGKQSEDKPYTHNKEGLPIPHEVSSLHILSKYIQLTEDETVAILYHNGLYVPLGREISGKERPLMMLLHFCDMWASRVIEPGIEIKEVRWF